MAAILTPTEDQVFDGVWQAIKNLFDDAVAPNIFKGFQNMTATALGSYVAISPGINVRQDQVRHDYDATNQLVIVGRHTTYSYQVDCYGPAGPDYANAIAIAWRSTFMANYATDNALPFQVLYADEPQQLNITNGENQYEQRFMLKLYLQVNQTVALPQDFFTTAPAVTIEVPADNLPVSV
jgi:hypothetical protein